MINNGNYTFASPRDSGSIEWFSLHIVALLHVVEMVLIWFIIAVCLFHFLISCLKYTGFKKRRLTQSFHFKAFSFFTPGERRTVIYYAIR